MKLAWYTPYSHHSAIARFSQLVIQSLRKHGHEVRVIRSEAKTPALKTAMPVSADEDFVWAWDWERHLGQHASEHDLFVYNLGDHYDNHCYCFHHQQHVPGLSIVHDYSLHHALLQYCVSHTPQFGEYLDHVVAENGPDTLATYDRVLKEQGAAQWWNHEIAQYPVYRWTLQNTLGVIAHAEFYREILGHRLGVPTTAIPLAYDTVWSPVQAATPRRNELARDGKMIVVTIGTVNSNKRHHSVIQAISQSKFLRERCQYRIVGHCEPAARQAIDRLLESLPHRPDVVVTGSVSREVLAKELAEANIISCLRYPALEGASASVIEGLLTGKPVLVSKTGCYLEIPDALVMKIDPQHERSELLHTLEQLARHYEHACVQSEEGRLWAEQRHAPDAYATQLIEFAERVLYNRPVLTIADRLADQFQRWNAQPDPQFLTRMDHLMQDLFANSQRAPRAA